MPIRVSVNNAYHILSHNKCSCSDHCEHNFPDPYSKAYHIMNTRQSPITTPKMIVSRLLRKLILFTRLLIKGNLLVKSLSLVWTAFDKDALWKKSNLLKKWPPLKPLFGLQGSPWCPTQCLFVHQSSVQSF